LIKPCGVNVVLRPVDPSALEEPTQNGKVGFGLSEKAKPEEAIRWEVVAVGPGRVVALERGNVVLPLEVALGDIVILNMTNTAARDSWKKWSMLIDGERLMTMQGYRDDSPSGVIDFIVGHVSDNDNKETK
jgi:co-chaperonin GroES (HSP10)